MKSAKRGSFPRNRIWMRLEMNLDKSTRKRWTTVSVDTPQNWQRLEGRVRLSTMMSRMGGEEEAYGAKTLSVSHLCKISTRELEASSSSTRRWESVLYWGR